MMCDNGNAETFYSNFTFTQVFQRVVPFVFLMARNSRIYNIFISSKMVIFVYEVDRIKFVYEFIFSMFARPDAGRILGEEGAKK